MKVCSIVESLEQRVVESPTKTKQIATLFEGEGWAVEIPGLFIEELDSPLLSPFAYLYDRYKSEGKHNRLWIFVGESGAFLTIFRQDRPFISKSCKKELLAECAESLLRDYYKREGSDFIEEIELYALAPIEERLEERLLLPVNERIIASEEVCKNEKLHFKKKEKPNYLLIAALTLLFLAFVGYDLYLKYRISQDSAKVKKIIDKQIELVNQKNDYESQLLKLSIAKPVVSDLLSANEFLVQKLHSIFDLVPDDSYLTKFVMDEKVLMIEGVSKDIAKLKETLYKELSSFYPEHSIQIKRSRSGVIFKMAFKE